MIVSKKISKKMNELFANWKTQFLDDDMCDIVYEPSLNDLLLDPMYSFPEDQTLELLTILEKPLRNNVWIQGPTGCGKTMLVRNLMAILGPRFYEINANAQMTTQDIFGRTRARAGETYWVEGIVPKWLKSGGVLLVNEYDTFDSIVVNALKPCLEYPRRLCLTENDDEMIEGHENCRLIVACNTSGRGDDTGMFNNTEVQSIADLRRFDAFIEIDYIPKEQAAKMLKAAFPEVAAKAIDHICTVAHQTQEAFKKGAQARVLSTAECINWVENYNLFTTGHHSARISFLNGYEQAPRMAVRDMINATFGHENSETLHDPDTAARAADASTDETEADH